jgi:hypothetical protein
MFYPINPQSEELIYGSPEAPELVPQGLEHGTEKHSEEVGDDDQDH